MNKQTIDLDVITGGVPQVLHVAQYDTGARTLEFNIYSSNNDLDLIGATAKISGRKADGLGFEYPATITDGVVVADCTDQMTAVAGIVECAITLMNSEGQIQTARFDLNVKPAPLNDDSVISDSDFPLIEQAIEAESKAEEYAEEAEAWAVGTKNGEPVPVDDPTYENNAKYWAEQAAQTDIGQIEKVKVSWDDATESVQKNLLVYPYNETTKTVSGITYTDLGDGRVKINGTATAFSSIFCQNRTSPVFFLPAGEYAITGCPSGGGASIYKVRIEYKETDTSQNVVLADDIGNGATFVVSDTASKCPLSVVIGVYSGATINNLIFEPMIRKATIKDDTWTPYIPNNTELITWKANGILGAKNLIPYPYYRESGYTTNGVTFTVNSDGTVTANGTATNTAYFAFSSSVQNLKYVQKGVRYTLSVDVTGASSTSKVSIFINPDNSSYESAIRAITSDGHYEIDFTGWDISYNGVNCDVYLTSGGIYNNLTFSPMLRLAEDTDDTYQSYAMTNKELTDFCFRNETLGISTTSPINIDNITTPGAYYLRNNTVSGLPEGTNGELIVVGVPNSYQKQIFFRQGTPGSNDSNMYVRGFNPAPNVNAWGPWWQFTGTLVQ